MGKLLKFQCDWADEFDVYGFAIYTNDEEYEEALKLHKENFEKRIKDDDTLLIGFGTNEDLEFNNYEDLMRSFKIKDISKEEAEVIHNLFGDNFGVCPFPLEY